MTSLRFEHKYVIDLAAGDNIWEDLQPFCVPDPHAHPRWGYEVASLYYDTPDLRFFWDREESVGYRRKIRLRTYLPVEGLSNPTKGSVALREPTALFLEIKEKHKQRVGKKRVALDKNLLQNISGEHKRLDLRTLIDAAPDCAATREINYLTSRFSLRPTTIIRYIRRTLIGKFDSSLRITLDYQVTCGGSSLLSFSEQEESFLVDPRFAILEVKCNGRLPLWLQSALLKHELFRTRFSKYCNGVRTLPGITFSQPFGNERAIPSVVTPSNEGKVSFNQA